MLEELIKKATGGLDGIVDDLLKAATDKIKEKVSEVFSVRRLESLKENISRVGKVKTILNPDTVVDLEKIYFPKAVCFDAGIFIERADFFSSKQVLIEGGPGQGKSLYLKHICLTEGRGSNFIPIFIEFRYLNFEKSLKEELFEAIRSFGVDLDDGLFDYLARSKRILFILDGFDEVPNNARLRTARELENIGRTYPELRIIVSSRPDSGMGASVYFKKYKIAALPLNQQIEFIKNLYDDKLQAYDIVSVLKESRFISEVTNTPLLLTLFTITYNARQFKPDSLSEFYSLIFPTMLYRHDRMKIGYERERKAGLTDYQMQRLFEALSFFSLKDNKTRFGSANFRKFLEVASKIESIGENIEDKLIDDITNITALIIPDGFDRYSYAHKSIQEYFAAVFISRLNESNKIGFYGSMVRSFEEFIKWQNVLSFLETIDHYYFNKYYLIPARKNVFGIDSSGKVILSFDAIKKLIGIDSKLKINEDGNIVTVYWGDTYSSSVYKEGSDYMQTTVLSFLRKRTGELAEFLSYCDESDFEMYRHDDGSFIVNIVEFFRKTEAQKSIAAYASERFETSELKAQITLAENELQETDTILNKVLNFD